MAKGLIGKKLGCTQLFKPDGGIIPVTVIQAGPCRVTAKRTREKEGYDAIQLGFEVKKPVRVQKDGGRRYSLPEQGEAQKSGGTVFRRKKEFKVEDPGAYQVGQDLLVTIFAEGDRVKVTGRSIGKGFQGVIKRYHHHGGPESHGSMFNRAPGSIGCSAYPSRVIKGRGLPGHMGNRQVTTRNLVVIKIRPEDNLLLIKGAVPGPRSGFVWIEKLEQGN